MGMALFTTSFFWLASPPLIAALIGIGLPSSTPSDDPRVYLPASLFCGSVVILGAGIFGVACYLRKREIGSWKV